MPVYIDSDTSMEDFQQRLAFHSQRRCNNNFHSDQSSISKSLCHKDDTELRCLFYCNKERPKMYLHSNGAALSCNSNNRITSQKKSIRRHNAKGHMPNNKFFGSKTHQSVKASPSWSDYYNTKKKRPKKMLYYQNEMLPETLHKINSCVDILYNPLKVQKKHNLQNEDHSYHIICNEDASHQQPEGIKIRNQISGRKRKMNNVIPVSSDTSSDNSLTYKLSLLNNTYKIASRFSRKKQFETAEQRFGKKRNNKGFALALSSDDTDGTDSANESSSSIDGNLFDGHQHCTKREKPTVDKLVLVEGQEIFESSSEESHFEQKNLKKRRRIRNKEAMKRKVIKIIERLDAGDGNKPKTEIENNNSFLREEVICLSDMNTLQRVSNMKPSMSDNRPGSCQESSPEQIRYAKHILGFKNQRLRNPDLFAEPKNGHNEACSRSGKTNKTRKAFNKLQVMTGRKKLINRTRITSDEDESMNNARALNEQGTEKDADKTERTITTNLKKSECTRNIKHLSQVKKRFENRKEENHSNLFNPIIILLASIPIAWLIIKIIATTNNSEFVIEPLFWFGDRSPASQGYPASQFRKQTHPRPGHIAFPKHRPKRDLRVETQEKQAKRRGENPTVHNQKKRPISSDEVMHDLKKLKLESFAEEEKEKTYPSYTTDSGDYSRDSKIPLDLYMVEDDNDDNNDDENINTPNRMDKRAVHEKALGQRQHIRINNKNKNMNNKKMKELKFHDKKGPLLRMSPKEDVIQFQQDSNIPSTNENSQQRPITPKHNPGHSRKPIRFNKVINFEHINNENNQNTREVPLEKSGKDMEVETTKLLSIERTRIDSHGKQSDEVVIQTEDENTKPTENDDRAPKDGNKAREDNQEQQKKHQSKVMPAKEDQQVRKKQCGRWPNFFFKSCWGF